MRQVAFSFPLPIKFMKGEDGTLSSKIVHQHLGLVDIQRILRHALWVPVGFPILGGNDNCLDCGLYLGLRGKESFASLSGHSARRASLKKPSGILDKPPRISIYNLYS